MSEIHSDPLDLGADLAQRERDASLEAIRNKVKPIVPSEVCLYCGEKTLNGARWCGPDCRSDYERMEEPAKVGW